MTALLSALGMAAFALACVAILASYVDVPAEHLNLEKESLWSTWRQARRLTHPDCHAGDQTKWDHVELAARVLGVTA